MPSSSPNNQEQESGTTRESPVATKSVFSKVARAGRKPKLNKFFETHQDVYKKILMFIEQGVYDYIAAESMGVTGQTWFKWLRIGEDHYNHGRRSYYAQFFIDVRTAQSRGRLLAELEVRRDDPKFYLRCGPGKTAPGRPGWTETIHVGGDEGMPLEHRHEGDPNAGDNMPSSLGDLAATLLIMEQLGFIQASDLGKSLIRSTQSPHTRDVVSHALPVDAGPSSPSGNSGMENPSTNLDNDDEDNEDLSPTDEGYAPELKAPSKPPSPGGNDNGRTS